jgi:hypothetical protein
MASMSRSKARPHRIVVDDVEYVWRLGKCDSHGLGLEWGDYLIALADEDGAALIVNLDCDRTGNGKLTPHVVAEFIRASIAVGWKPHAAGPPYRVGTDALNTTP